MARRQALGSGAGLPWLPFTVSEPPPPGSACTAETAHALLRTLPLFHLSEVYPGDACECGNARCMPSLQGCPEAGHSLGHSLLEGHSVSSYSSLGGRSVREQRGNPQEASTPGAPSDLQQPQEAWPAAVVRQSLRRKTEMGWGVLSTQTSVSTTCAFALGTLPEGCWSPAQR